MSTVNRFEDLRAWKTARELVNLIYAVTQQPAFGRDFALRDQIRRAAISVMSNIAEGFGAGSDAEFIKFLGYSRRSACETESQAFIAMDQKYITPNDFEEIYAKAVQVERQVNALISYLDRSRRGHAVKDEQRSYNLDLPDTP